MIYTITKIERKTTSTGKQKADVSLLNPDGVEKSGVTIWGDYPNFDTLKEGDKTSGDIAMKVVGNNTYYTLYPERTNSLYPKKAGAVNITKAMETKNEHVKEAQERKQDGIKLAGIQRDAVLIVTTFYKDSYKLHTDEEMEEAVKNKIVEWKKTLEQYYGDNVPF